MHGELNQNVAGAESSGRSGRNIPVAIAVGAGLAGVFFGLLKIGPAALMVFVVGALILAAAEFYRSVRSLGYRPATLIGLTAVAGLSIGAYTRGAETYPVVLGLVSSRWSLLVRVWLRGRACDCKLGRDDSRHHVGWRTGLVRSLNLEPPSRRCSIDRCRIRNSGLRYRRLCNREYDWSK